MKKNLFLTVLFAGIFSLSGLAQTPEQEVQKVIESLFDGMRTKNADQVAAVFSENAIMQTIAMTAEGTKVNSGSVADFVKRIGSAPPEVQLDERILDYQIKIDGPMATAWTPYEFYANGNFSHCGVNSFQLVKFAEGWKVIYIIDTRRKEPCNQ